MASETFVTFIGSIEGNREAYLRCLVVKEALQLQNVRFLYGDLIASLESLDGRYDGVLACGVLYHMTEPVKLIRLISNVASRVMLWSHFYDEGVVRNNGKLRRAFGGWKNFEEGGFAFKARRYNYGGALGWKGFCGGAHPHSFWLEKETIVQAFKHFGFDNHQVHLESREHPSGPHFCAYFEK